MKRNSTILSFIVFLNLFCEISGYYCLVSPALTTSTITDLAVSLSKNLFAVVASNATTIYDYQETNPIMVGVIPTTTASAAVFIGDTFLLLGGDTLDLYFVSNLSLIATIDGSSSATIASMTLSLDQKRLFTLSSNYEMDVFSLEDPYNIEETDHTDLQVVKDASTSGGPWGGSYQSLIAYNGDNIVYVQSPGNGVWLVNLQDHNVTLLSNTQTALEVYITPDLAYLVVVSSPTPQLRNASNGDFIENFNLTATTVTIVGDLWNDSTIEFWYGTASSPDNLVANFTYGPNGSISPPSMASAISSNLVPPTLSMLIRRNAYGSIVMAWSGVTADYPTQHSRLFFITACSSATPVSTAPAPSPVPTATPKIPTPSTSLSQVSTSNNVLSTITNNTRVLEQESSSQNTFVTIIVSSVIGGLIFAVTIVAAVVFFLYRKMRRNAENNIPNSPQRESNFPRAESKSQLTERSQKLAEPLGSWKINPQEVVLGEKLGQGAFGVVYKASWRNAEYVVKQLKVTDQDYIEAFLKEATHMKDIRGHVNVCRFVGVIIAANYPVSIMTEYIPDGSLWEMIQNNQIVIDNIKVTDQDYIEAFLKEATHMKDIRGHVNVCRFVGVIIAANYPVSIMTEYIPDGSLWEMIQNNQIVIDNIKLVQSLAKDTAAGMSHIHAENILHCDLSARNLLVKRVGSEYIIKITDFGMAHQTASETYNLAANVNVPYRWCSPEVFKTHQFSKASDVWSFGVVLWEITEQKKPYYEMTNKEVISYVLKGGRLNRPQKVTVPDRFWEMMRACWVPEPHRRPTFKELSASLDALEVEQ
eukprot:TRINITY_DN6400_c0_g1_i1.p1 TRINITY_DN6400_c0_g1~~TRINITY_DN6400_c0_g1_i1.p1  ORF type:complete len:814 (-),score=151.96 TRINITY_DN6400_c0_g1_i1:13-2454(-)